MTLVEAQQEFDNKKKKIMDKYNKYVNRIKEIEQEILSLPQKILTNTINWINEKRAKLERKLLELKQAIQDWIMKKLQQLQDWINKLLDNIKRFIQKQLERLANAILGLLD